MNFTFHRFPYFFVFLDTREKNVQFFGLFCMGFLDSTSGSTPDMLKNKKAGLVESGWEWDWGSPQQEPEKELRPAVQFYVVPPLAPVSPWPADAPAHLQLSFCPLPPSAWQYSQIGP